jgi:ribonuclease Y
MNGLLLALVAVVSSAAGWFFNTRFGRNSIEAGRIRAAEQIRQARRKGDKIKQQAALEAQEETLRQREKTDRDLRSRRKQLKKRENDLSTGKSQLQTDLGDLEKARAELETRDAALEVRSRELDESAAHLERLIEDENMRLERVADLTQDDAKRQLLRNLKAKTRFEAARMVKEIKDDAQRGAEKEATKILALAVERASSDFSAERTIHTIQVPKGPEMKGRIIGHEGKNIRAFEQATGIQMILDDEGKSITFSGYNPVRRELAQRVLKALLKDGNINPKRIEELTKRNLKRLEEEMVKAGQETLRELKIKNVHPEMVKLLGRLKFRTSYSQNVLQHSKEVAYLTGMLAAELRLDEKLARRAGLFHDIGKAVDYEQEGTHPEIGAEIGTKYKEHETVVNAIASHHEDCEATSPISVLVMAADGISGARPGARRKSVAEYIKRIERLEDMANSMKGVDYSYALHAGREIRVIAKPKQLDDAQIDLLASDLTERIQNEMDYPGKIKVTVIREMRGVEYAQ